jgi:hypothetical protein
MSQSEKINSQNSDEHLYIFIQSSIRYFNICLHFQQVYYQCLIGINISD